MKRSNPKKCKVCKGTYTQTISTLQQTCLNPRCILTYSEQQAKKKQKKEMLDRKINLKPANQWRRELQQVFNQYIRQRDIGKPCISCGVILSGKYDAGHYYSVGSYPNLRYHEDNCHGQCVHCNQHLHGNLLEYQPRLVQRIGQDRVDALYYARNERLSLTIPAIQNMIKEYRNKLKHIK